MKCRCWEMSQHRRVLLVAPARVPVAVKSASKLAVCALARAALRGRPRGCGFRDGEFAEVDPDASLCSPLEFHDDLCLVAL